MKQFECDHCGKVVENPSREDIHWMPDEVALETGVATVCTSCVSNFEVIANAFAEMSEEEQKRDYMILWIQNHNMRKPAVTPEEATPEEDIKEEPQKEREEADTKMSAEDFMKTLSYDDDDIQVVPFGGPKK